MSTGRQRVDGALQLAPMTVNQLARCLTLSAACVRNALGELHSQHHVVRYRMRDCSHRMGSPGYVYERRIADAKRRAK